MAFARIGSAAVQSGRMPRICMCCGQQAEHLIEHRFYYDPISLMVLGLVLPKLSRYLAGYAPVDMSVPLCGSHQHRFRLMSILGYSILAVALLFVPLMIYFTYTKQAATAQGWMAVILIVVVGALLCAMLALRLLSPRLVEIRGDYLGFTSVSNEFAGAFGGGSAPSGGIRMKELGLALGIAGIGFVLLIGVGAIASWWANSARQRQSDKFFADSKAESDRFAAEMRARHESGQAGGPIPPAQQGPPGTSVVPPIVPSHDDIAEEHRRLASMTHEERDEYFRKKAQGKFGPPPGTRPGSGNSSTTVTPAITPPIVTPPVVAPSPAVTPEVTTPSVVAPTTPSVSPPSTPAVPKARRGQPRQQVQSFEVGSTKQILPPASVLLPPNTQLPKDEEVWVLWGSLWYPATVVEANATGVKIHYTGYADNFDEVKEWDEVAIDTSILAELTGSVENARPQPPMTASENAARQWVDSTGKFKIEGKLVSFKQGKVTILKTDGQEITVPLNKLSAADQKHVAELPAEP